MARPRVRTAAVTAAESREVRELFGTLANAYARLMPGGAPLDRVVFQRVAAGRASRPDEVAALRKALADWKGRKLK